MSLSPRYRLLAVDLDGTLLNSRRQVPRENVEAIRAAARAGVAIAVVTGRRFPALRPFVEPLGVDLHVVANSGAIIRRGLEGPILFRRFLPLSTALRVLELADGAAMEPVVHDGPDAEGRIVLRSAARSLPSMARYLNKSSPPPEWVDAIRLERAPVQIGFTGGVVAIRAFESRLAAELRRSGCEASLARTEYPEEDLALLDVLALEATKSKALGFIASRLGVDAAGTMAIGDNWNDVDMLESAGLGVLMGNAVEELKVRGFATTFSNDDAGVAHAIASYLLAGC